ncbi:PQQ-binding-like beta-propeller repeat protein [Pseudonocardia sp. CA-107938]|uniref:outer membrane protein assembly factor BamB family protein n=1 Tax=Pseudonocardia sp. CA-107938 TaxID=3240021 RepID=UPI003D8BCEDB
MRVLPAVLVAVAVLTAGCGAPQPPAPPPVQPLPGTAQIWTRTEGWQQAPAMPAAAAQRRWSVPVPAGARTAANGTGVVVLAVPQGGGTRVDRLDLATGAPRWSVTVPGTDARVGLDGWARPVVTVEADTTTVLDAADGRVLWQAPRDQGDSVDALPDLLLVRSHTATTAVDRGTGARRWQVRHQIAPRDGALVVEDLAPTAGGPGTDGVADPATGEPRWTQQNPLFTDVTVVGDRFVRTADVEPGPDTVTAYDLATGAQRWTAEVDGIARAEVTPLDPDTLLVSGGGEVGLGAVAVSAVDGRVLWRTDRSPSTVLRLDGAPWAYREGDHAVTVLDGRTGAARQHQNAGSAVLAGGGIYVTDGVDVVANGLLDLAEHWRLPGVGDVYGLDPVPGGLVTVVGTAEPRTLAAYLT